MMIRKTALALVMVLNLAVCGAFAAAQAKSTASTTKSKPTKEVAAPASQNLPPIRVTNGTVTTVTDNKMAISHKVHGKAEEVAFALNPDTKREGDLAVGSTVTVRYRVQGGENVATMVKGKMAKGKKSGKA